MKRIDQKTEEVLGRFRTLISARHDVAGTIVYGSRARGTHRPDSDADVAVLLRGEHQPFLTAKLDMADVAFDVLLETGILISPLPVWLDEWQRPEAYSNPDLLHNHEIRQIADDTGDSVEPADASLLVRQADVFVAAMRNEFIRASIQPDPFSLKTEQGDIAIEDLQRIIATENVGK